MEEDTASDLHQWELKQSALLQAIKDVEDRVGSARAALKLSETKDSSLNKFEQGKKTHLQSLNLLIQQKTQELYRMENMFRELGLKVELKEWEVEGLFEKLKSNEVLFEPNVKGLEFIAGEVRECMNVAEMRVLFHFEELKLAAEKVNEFDEEVRLREKEMEQRANEVAFREKEVELGMEEVNVKDKRVSELLNEVQLKKIQLDSLKKSLEEREKHLDSLQRSMEEHGKCLDSLESVELREKHLDSLQKRVEERERDLDSRLKTTKEHGKHLDSLQKSVEERKNTLDSLSHELLRKERDLEQQAKELELKQKEFESWVLSISSDQSCIKMHGRTLQLLFDDQFKRNEISGSHMSDILHASADPAKWVVDVVKEFYPSNLTVNNRDIEFELQVVGKNCILLLKELKRMTPQINHYVREEARKFAADWKAKMTSSTENSLEVLCFLQLIATYELTDICGVREFQRLLTMIEHLQQESNIMPSLVQNNDAESSLGGNPEEGSLTFGATPGV